MLPKNLEILNITDNNIIKGRANSPLDLICLVKSGKPPEVLRWRKNKIIFKQGGPSELVFSFIPDKTDHQSVYSCEVQNPDMETPFTKTIHLDIACKHNIYTIRYRCLKYTYNEKVLLFVGINIHGLS